MLASTPIVVTARGGTWSWTPATAVVVAGRATDCGTECGTFEAMCPHTVFHASPETARAHLASHGDLDAQILGHDTAIECGRLNFGTLTSKEHPPMLEPLFDAELGYQPGMPALSCEGDGALIGSGDGAVHGPKLTGTLEWTLFEQPGSTVCPMAPVARS